MGGDEVSYGRAPKDAPNWREKMLREVTLDASRTHFVGKLPRAEYIKVLQVSAAHVYLTYPFVLSWSLLEAMACGVNLVASDTAPVREVVRDGVNGRLVPFGDDRAIAQALHAAVDARLEDQPLRSAARISGMAFSQRQALAAYTSWVSGRGDVDASRPRPLGGGQASVHPRAGAGVQTSDATARDPSSGAAKRAARPNTGHGTVPEPKGVPA